MIGLGFLIETVVMKQLLFEMFLLFQNSKSQSFYFSCSSLSPLIFNRHTLGCSPERRTRERDQRPITFNDDNKNNNTERAYV